MAGFGYAELHTPYVEKAQGFYGELLNWKFKPMETPMGTYFVGDALGMMKDDRPYWLPYVNVDDVAASASKAEKLGGKVVQPVTKIDAGTFAVVTDPMGAAFALWKPAK